MLRVATGAALVAVALAAVWLGGQAFLALVAAGTLVMFAEWAVMQRMTRGVRLAGLILLAGAIALMSLVSTAEALMALAAGAAILGLFSARSGTGFSRSTGVSTVFGVLYCGLPAIALIWLRELPLGLPATVFVLVSVWATDIAAFFAGRAIGGAKLAPSISPNKTWAGAFGGIAGAMAVCGGLAIGYLSSIDGHGAVLFIPVAGMFAVLSILGDLFESWLKRRAGVKDSGSLLPGHGGVMDRLDGLVPVAIAGAAFFAVSGWAG
ncbi:phosphatidate cytidylyltransferase [Polymorphobacter glacialis]|uniref:Phosphatidate cytidylyltransferase n=1 Tax=Sandarakinorhabdus glacialis TaxID=1614636 RepID=A0A917E4T8_9SPHN|nr:phosphatidate cytidylyltransferase [Polymorphobacter glacialis]GGE00909.1 phosphatidate cytidylyltransferase [Polymorphobacter glacialis]